MQLHALNDRQHDHMDVQGLSLTHISLFWPISASTQPWRWRIIACILDSPVLEWVAHSSVERCQDNRFCDTENCASLWSRTFWDSAFTIGYLRKQDLASHVHSNCRRQRARHWSIRNVTCFVPDNFTGICTLELYQPRSWSITESVHWSNWPLNFDWSSLKKTWKVTKFLCII